MSITLAPISHDNLCYGYTWTIADADLLAEHIATVALGRSRHIQKVLSGVNLANPATSESAKTAAIKLLTVTGIDPWHRDGWIFQVMSWIAANRASPNGIISFPQMIHAQKGFDGLQLEVDSAKSQVVAAIIFEDKATTNPRDTINNLVWPEFKEMEAGEKENVLLADVTALLSTRPELDADVAIENILWREVRRYRVSITISDTHNSEAGRARLFKDYDEIAPGIIIKRRAETFYIQDLRQWMQDLADRAIELIQQR